MATVPQLIRSYARRYGVDPRAAIAVARGEGGLVNRANDVGDKAGGGSYGPFQLYAQGALPSRYRGNPRAADAWAWSPAGIEYALRQMASVGARGLRGEQAVRTIISRFEKPADIPGSIAAALARYGSGGGGGGSVAASASQGATGANIGDIGDSGGGRSAFARALLNPQTMRDPMALLGAIKATQAPTEPGGRPDTTGASPPVSDPQFSSGGSALSQLLPLASKFGLTVTSTTGGTHVPGSWHYKKRAADYGGDAARMMSLMRYALKNPHLFKEAFYDPAGVYIKNGKVYRGSIGGHGDHVHLAR